MGEEEEEEEEVQCWVLSRVYGGILSSNDGSMHISM